MATQSSLDLSTTLAVASLSPPTSLRVTQPSQGFQPMPGYTLPYSPSSRWKPNHSPVPTSLSDLLSPALLPTAFPVSALDPPGEPPALERLPHAPPAESSLLSPSSTLPAPAPPNRTTGSPPQRALLPPSLTAIFSPLMQAQLPDPPSTASTDASTPRKLTRSRSKTDLYGFSQHTESTKPLSRSQKKTEARLVISRNSSLDPSHISTSPSATLPPPPIGPIPDPVAPHWKLYAVAVSSDLSIKCPVVLNSPEALQQITSTGWTWNRSFSGPHARALAKAWAFEYGFVWQCPRASSLHKKEFDARYPSLLWDQVAAAIIRKASSPIAPIVEPETTSLTPTPPALSGYNLPHPWVKSKLNFRTSLAEFDRFDTILDLPYLDPDCMEPLLATVALTDTPRLSVSNLPGLADGTVTPLGY